MFKCILLNVRFQTSYILRQLKWRDSQKKNSCYPASNSVQNCDLFYFDTGHFLTEKRIRAV